MKRLLTWTVAALFTGTVATAANKHEVNICYQGATVAVDVATDIQDLVTVQVTGADVVIGQRDDVAEEITYRLSGYSNNGSFTHAGDFKITLAFEGLQLTSQTGAAVTIKNGKRIAVVLADGTDNILTDAEQGGQKACMVVKGHSEFQGDGTLTINGRTKHAYKGNEYVLIKKSTGTLNLNSTMKDGFHIDEYFEMKGGTLNIKTTGDGYWDDEELKTKSPACINTAASVIIEGGVLNLVSTGEGGKGMNCDSCFTLTDGTVAVTTTGQRYIYENYEGNRHDTDNIPDSLKNSPKAIKAELGLFIGGGSLTIHTEHDGGEGLESKDTLNICGGALHIEAFDDCINAAGNVRISGGELYLSSANNDGIDTNQSLFISGGDIVTQGHYLHELGIDVNDKSERKKLYITGGTVVCVGGTDQIPHPVACEDGQPSIFYKGQVGMGAELLLRCSSDGTEILRHVFDRDYKSEAGGTLPQLCLMFSSPLLKEGGQYELTDAATGTPLAATSSLKAPYDTMDANEGRFTRESFTLAGNTLPYRKARINTNDSATAPVLVLYLHGGSSRGSDNATQLNEAAVSIIYQYLYEHGIPATFIVPQCPTGGGWTSQLRRVVNELLKSCIATDQADANRIYVLGGSMGGTGTWCQLSHFPNFYAAAMPVAGNPTGFNAVNVATTPVYTVMGTADNIMNMDAVAQFKTDVEAAGGTVCYDVETGWTHQNTCERSYTDERLEWLFSQSRSTIATAITPTSTDVNDIPRYNLQGMRVDRSYKGIVIQRGKKCYQNPAAGRGL